MKYIAKIGINSESRRWKWLRKYYWNFEVRHQVMKNMTNDYKVCSYFADYLRTSIGAKEYFINHGLVATRKILISKLEELERFVLKYKHNTFDNLNWEETDFINWYEENEKSLRRKPK